MAMISKRSPNETGHQEAVMMEKTVPRNPKDRLTELLETLAVTEGSSPSCLEGVRFLRGSRPHPRAPIVYDPSILIVGQGQKRVYLGDQVYVYDPSHYLVLSVPLPVECETEATPQEPLLGVAVRVDPAEVGELLLEMDDHAEIQEPVQGVFSTVMTDELRNVTIRLLECLQSSRDSRILGAQIVREIVYRVLCGAQGDILRAIAVRNSHFSQISRVLRRIHQEFHQTFDVETLAGEANMSVSAFHHNFKAVTSTSPLQYLKSIRLHKARLMMFQDGLNASMAAERVGYASPSQFSREFKRFFGDSPTQEVRKLRAQTD